MKTKAFAITTVIWAVLWLFMCEIVNAIEIPEPPKDLTQCESWEPNADIPGNVTFTCGGQKFAFPIKADGPEKDCAGVRVIANEVHLITVGQKAWHYLVVSSPHAYWMGGEWLFIGGKSWGIK